MKSKIAKRDENSQIILDSALTHGLLITKLPDGQVMICLRHRPNAPVIIYDKKRWLGDFLAAIIADSGQVTWELKRK